MPANTPPIEELERALEKARDRFREYEDEEARLLVSDAPYARGLHAAEQSKHREMANMLDGAIASTLPQLLSLAKLGLLVREGGEEVAALNLPEMPPTIDRRPMYDDEPDGYLESDQDWSRDNDEAVRWLADNHRAIRAVLRTLEGLIK